MFTGIIKHVARFHGYRLNKQELVIEPPRDLLAGLKRGDSLAVNGVCLTVRSLGSGRASFDLSRETLDKTTLGSLAHADILNVELPLTLSEPLSGHLVTGHVDTVGRIKRFYGRAAGKRMEISLDRGLLKFVVAKGSVAVNGVSLTVAGLGKNSFEVELIPLTLKWTNLGRLATGDAVNIECDIIAKYVYNYILQKDKKY